MTERDPRLIALDVTPNTALWPTSSDMLRGYIVQGIERDREERRQSELGKVVYAFTREDVLNLEATISLAIDAYHTGAVQPAGEAGEKLADAHLQWLAALRNDITEQLRGLPQ